ncbi:MAG: hypothetical protein HZY74_00045 [Brevundimonas sp.]|nr:MAG: hypothetical protein HZY74_00045 [Brevundimonas sp.]
MNRKPQDLRIRMLHCLCEGMSQRSCERIFEVSQNTVAKLFAEVGDWAIEQMKSIKNLRIANIQADELHSFVAAKEKNLSDMIDPPEGAGRVWTYLAMCADSKLILEYHLGDQDALNASEFLKKVAGKLERSPDGGFVVRPHLATDGLKAYTKAFRNAFGADADYGILEKQYDKQDKNGNKAPGGRYIGANRKKGSGDWRVEDTHTSYIERQNLNLRMGNRRFNRKTNAFSKTMLNHERHIAMWAVYHNYCWIPRPMRPRLQPDGTRSSQWIKRDPAAIAAGLATRLWSVADMLTMADDFTAERRLMESVQDEEPPSEPIMIEVSDDDVVLAPSHWVYSSSTHQSTKVHKAECAFCRDGQGRKAGAKPSGVWMPYYSLEDAIAASVAIQPDDHSICNVCLGDYFKRGYYP